MNIIEVINNKFLISLFPEGLKDDILLGQVGLDIADQVSLNIHVTQRPEKEVAKWGVWGKDYNVIVIKIIGQFLRKVEIVNWQKITSSELIFLEKGDFYSFNLKGDEWSVSLELEALTFQRCDIYSK
ncbi:MULTISPECIES: hypothetical protein [Photorhabdus]|uniref:Photorhabdus luminescens subsp. laumondii TTO1 complete genome segment 11/17 n=1 Tax=Photorhabdus laumondii subsp. laumondii (strain DSM 15139 / CIP 105565 / TT01) TaxID=243265 RepID=Q7N2G4_PHOLL|nr:MULTISPECIES: hypothetical protein [Photorhabdus]AWK42817.1 hypothetical protein A4R40_15575 [Photorhabdus laumondii subsp. laumondii]AXG43590.1 hypothetical protein PluDJC_15935 [Photorhabdus laumondii subsp. laumondii]AXG48133.1 hypothetical protein PluTT01m_16045 [Photorhabdus laumondii subsp. laumondii]KTL60040.1 hypothetical protein AA106_14605 [Photorhabdus laumondii subsp. laumondii]MCC8389108.1 hypothetical protein [Photorhabdus laumondii]